MNQVALSNSPRVGSIEYWALENPTKIAIYEGSRELSWAEWNEKANRVAQALTDLGIVPGDIVAISCQIRIEWALLSGALAKLGCPILGVNWRLTPTELEYVLSNSGAQAFVTDAKDPASQLTALQSLKLKLAVSIDTPADKFASWNDLLLAVPTIRNSAQDAPVVIYTSGTTGLPKGVAPPAPSSSAAAQRMLEYAESIASSVSRAATDVTLVTLPFSHGAGPALVRASVVAGNTMVFLRRYDPELALQVIEKYRVSIWVAVPTMLKRIASLPEEVLKKYDTSSIRVVQTGAAPVPFSLKAWTMQFFGADVLHEAYGATEVGMISHLTPEMHKSKPESSGRLNRHVEVSVRDTSGRLLPPKEAGELWVRTPVTIRSYLNAPPLDSTTLDESGFFRTGDIGYLDEDGYLYITDRAKDMIISGGVNIYPAEVEAALIQHPAVQDVAVIGIPNDEFGEEVKAFVEVKPGERFVPEVLIGSLMEFVKENLASYKRPKSIDIVSELPRNTMGKILKRTLRAPYWEGKERNV